MSVMASTSFVIERVIFFIYLIYKGNLNVFQSCQMIFLVKGFVLLALVKPPLPPKCQKDKCFKKKWTLSLTIYKTGIPDLQPANLAYVHWMVSNVPGDKV